MAVPTTAVAPPDPRTAVAVIARGKQWRSGMLRPAIEDLLGGGAVLSQFDPADDRDSTKEQSGVVLAN